MGCYQFIVERKDKAKLLLKRIGKTIAHFSAQYGYPISFEKKGSPYKIAFSLVCAVVASLTNWYDKNGRPCYDRYGRPLHFRK